MLSNLDAISYGETLVITLHILPISSLHLIGFNSLEHVIVKANGMESVAVYILVSAWIIFKHGFIKHEVMIIIGNLNGRQPHGS